MFQPSVPCRKTRFSVYQPELDAPVLRPAFQCIVADYRVIRPRSNGVESFGGNPVPDQIVADSSGVRHEGSRA
jgi:hypothetical protein